MLDVQRQLMADMRLQPSIVQSKSHMLLLMERTKCCRVHVGTVAVAYCCRHKV